MGRNKRTERVEVDEEEDRDNRAARGSDREERDDFEQPMFADAAESPLFVPRDEWPEGHALRWIRVEAGNAPDNTNWAKMSRIGWTPVPRSMYESRFPATPMPGMDQTATDQHIIFGGLCLCQRRLDLVERDRRAQERQTQEQGRTVESYVEGGNSNFPRRDFGSSAPQYERGVRPAQFKE